MPIWAGGGGGPGAVIPTVHFRAALGDYEALIAEASHNFNFAAIDFDDDSYLMLVIDGNIAAGVGADLELRINTVATANYFTNGSRIINGVQTLIDQNLQNQIQLFDASSSIGDAGFMVVIFITLAKGSPLDEPRIISLANSRGGIQNIGGVLGIDTANITDVEVRATGNNWAIGTRMTLYRMQRVAYQNAPI